MTVYSHVLFTTAGVQILKLSGSDLWLAYLFGVGPDLDHLIKLFSYIIKRGFREFGKIIVPRYLRKGKSKDERYHWRSHFQEPFLVLLIIPLSILINSYIPIVFFVLHLILDYSISYKKKPFFPFSKYTTTKSFLLNISDKSKEITIFILLVFINLILWLV